ncbi:MAG: sigma-70 family RNA polymerase sigma factor [Candidatus Zixiibacteriota bacterium]
MKRDQNISLADLVKNCQNGDKKSWMDLIERVTPLIYSICGKMGLSQEEIFDIFGQVSYLLLKNLHRLKSTDKILAYISTMTRREIYALSKKDKLRRKIEYSDLPHLTPPDIKTPDDIFNEVKRNQILMEALAKLNKREYNLIMALFFDPDCPSYEQIAKNLNIPVSSIGPYRARCLKKILGMIKRKL